MKDQKTAPDTRSIECEMHGIKTIVPYSAICTHLAHGQAKEWIRLEVPGTEYCDWLCPDCERKKEKLLAEMPSDIVRNICCNCVEILRYRYDCTFMPEPRLTPDQVIRSQIKIAGHESDYRAQQWELSNFDWMAYQLKYLEKILGKEDAGKWIERPNPALGNKTPARVVLQSPDDTGCKIVGDLVCDMITGNPS